MIDSEVLKRIDALAAKLGVAADHVWAVLVRQAQVEVIPVSYTHLTLPTK